MTSKSAMVAKLARSTAMPPATGTVWPCNLRRWSGLSVSPPRAANARASGVKSRLSPKLNPKKARRLGMGGKPFAQRFQRLCDLPRRGSKKGLTHGAGEFLDQIMNRRAFKFLILIGDILH